MTKKEFVELINKYDDNMKVLIDGGEQFIVAESSDSINITKQN